jgi:hypothetical protein
VRPLRGLVIKVVRQSTPRTPIPLAEEIRRAGFEGELFQLFSLLPSFIKRHLVPFDLNRGPRRKQWHYIIA